jgi:uncharacterized membrane protein YeaQ/YmgE (transglycosylase-associated protein family)
MKKAITRRAIAATAAMTMFRLRRDRSTTTSVSELAKLDSRFIGRILSAIRNQQQHHIVQPLYYANKSPGATAPPPPLVKRLFLRTAAPLTPTRVVAMLKRAWSKDNAPFYHREVGRMIENYGILGWIVIGLLAGGIAKLLMPGKDPGGCLITILLGIAGALLAGFLGKAVGWYDESEAAGFVAAVIGAFLILLIYRLVLRRR